MLQNGVFVRRDGKSITQTHDSFGYHLCRFGMGRDESAMLGRCEVEMAREDECGQSEARNPA